MSSDARWTGRLEVELDSPSAAEWLAAALTPESTREVPRGGAAIERPTPRRVAVAIWARDAGAMRAALNTYLGWIDLALATARAARDGAPVPP
ncbi:MAG TPA: KEOPS complex subunit Pcc1 [Thermoplasmata archaeon]|nr:KEOPS complex subunit Pcc1 [Thermoplasmata archaeon]